LEVEENVIVKLKVNNSQAEAKLKRLLNCYRM